MLFKNITNDRIEAYGHTWFPIGLDGDVHEVSDETLINKFSNYTNLEIVDAVVPRETPIPPGLKVDGRWSEKRLADEITKYMSPNVN